MIKVLRCQTLFSWYEILITLFAGFAYNNWPQLSDSAINSNSKMSLGQKEKQEVSGIS